MHFNTVNWAFNAANQYAASLKATRQDFFYQSRLFDALANNCTGLYRSKHGYSNVCIQQTKPITFISALQRRHARLPHSGWRSMDDILSTGPWFFHQGLMRTFCYEAYSSSAYRRWPFEQLTRRR